jgi:hypothetical protein
MVASNIVIHIWKAFAPKLAFVIESKVTNHANLKFVRNLTSLDFTPSYLKNNWIQKLQCVTYYMSILPFNLFKHYVLASQKFHITFA